VDDGQHQVDGRNIQQSRNRPAEHRRAAQQTILLWLRVSVSTGALAATRSDDNSGDGSLAGQGFAAPSQNAAPML
jgi:hypothetical protein